MKVESHCQTFAQVWCSSQNPPLFYLTVPCLTTCTLSKIRPSRTVAHKYNLFQSSAPPPSKRKSCKQKKTTFFVTLPLPLPLLPFHLPLYLWATVRLDIQSYTRFSRQHAIQLIVTAGADPVGGFLEGQDPPPPPSAFGATPKLHKEGGNVARMRANTTCFGC